MSHDTLAAAVLRLARPDFVRNVLSSIDPEWFPESLMPELEGYAFAKLNSLREMVEAMSDEEDAEELYRSLALLWLELKFEWTRYNQVMNYQVMIRGMADPLVLAKGGVCSAYVGMVEGVLEPRDVERMIDLSAEPLEFGKPDLQRIRAFIEKQAETAREVLGQAAATRTKVSALLADSDSEEARDAAEEVLRLERGAESLASSPLDFLWQDLEGAVLAEVSVPGWHYSLALQDSADLDIDLRLMAQLREVAVRATELLVRFDTLDSVEARAAASFSSSVAVEIGVRKPARGWLEVTVAADTSGRLLSAPTAESEALWEALVAGVSSAERTSEGGRRTAIKVMLHAVAARAAS